MVKNLIKKSISISLACLLLMGVNPVTSNAEGKRAYTFGTSYWDSNLINTGPIAEYAAKKYKSMGLSATSYVKPTYSILSGKTSYGNIRMRGDILFFSGHANNKLMSFNYHQKGGDYATGVYRTSSSYKKTSKYKYVGLPSSNISKVKLMVFGGCNTASTNTNIAQYAVDQGATTSIGWTDFLNVNSFKNWSKRFNNKLAEGSTVLEAAQYANSFSYMSNSVKKYKIYGNKNLRLCKNKSSAKSSNLSSLSRSSITAELTPSSLMSKGKYSKKVNLSTIKASHVKDIINKYDNTLNSYKYTYDVHALDSLNGTIDVNLKLNNVSTDNVMTITVTNGLVSDVNKFLLSKNNKVTSLNYKNINNTYKSKTLSKTKINSLKKSAKSKVESCGYKVLSQTDGTRFDLTNNKHAYIVTTKYETEDGAFGVDESVEYY